MPNQSTSKPSQNTDGMAHCPPHPPHTLDTKMGKSGPLKNLESRGPKAFSNAHNCYGKEAECINVPPSGLILLERERGERGQEEMVGGLGESEEEL